MKKTHFSILALLLFIACNKNANEGNQSPADSVGLETNPSPESPETRQNTTQEDKPDINAELTKYIDKRSKGVMRFESFEVINSRKVNSFGTESYLFTGNLKVTVLKSCWRLTSGAGRRDGLFTSREDKPQTESGGWEIAKAEYYEAGSTRNLNKLPVNFVKYDQGWELQDVTYE